MSQRTPTRKQRSDADPRARQTRQRLGHALIALIVEKSFEEITIQEVLERADVGRSTFYLHFRDKDDLLICQLETFLDIVSTSLTRSNEDSQRVLPVAELFSHIGGQNKVYRALSAAGRLPDFFELAQGYFARGIEARLRDSSRVPRRELAARSYALAASVLALLRWWIDHGEKEPPQAMDELFHRMVWDGI
jgi:AcrR family transcriptional regulator